MVRNIKKEIEQAEQQLELLRMIEKRYKDEPLLHLEDMVQEMRFSKAVSARDIVFTVLEFVKTGQMSVDGKAI